MKALALFAALLALPSAAWAHKPSDSYLRLAAPESNGEGLRMALRWDLALRDLDQSLPLDADDDRAITWSELRAADAPIRALVTRSLRASLGGAPCAIDIGGGPRVTHHSDGAYAVYDVRIDCARRGTMLALDYELFFARDPQHRGLLRAPDADGEHLEVFSAARRHLELALPEARRARGHLLRAIREGVHHIWTGYDHMLFLIALLLPAVLRRENKVWLPALSLRASVIEVLKIVTAFTAAHSVTLSLAALGFLSLPSRLVESAIAASVVLAALNNLVPVVRADRWLAAFALGLLHGFGFSATLTDLGLSRAALLPTLIGFNLGVELGQAAVVLVFFAVAFPLRRVTLYRRGFLQLGSVVIAAVALVWFIERAFGVTILSR